MTLLLPTDFVLRQNRSRRLEHTVRDGDGNIVDLTGLTGTAITWRLGFDSGGANVLEKTIGGGITITNAVGGKCEVLISDTDSAALLTNTVYYWETVVTIATDIVTVAIGYIKIIAEVS